MNPLNDTFIYRPSGTNSRYSEGIPVYSDWDEMYADLIASSVTAKTLVLDDSLLTYPTTIIIPAGTYDLEGVRVRGAIKGSSPFQGRVVVDYAATAVLTNAYYLENLVVWAQAVGKGSLLQYTTTVGGIFAIYRSCIFAAVASADPVISISGDETITLVLYDTVFSEWPLIDLTGTTPVISVKAFSGSQVSADVIASAVGALMDKPVNDATSYINPAQVDFLGTFSMDSPASEVLTYTTPWTTLIGDDVQAALNAADSELTTLGTGADLVAKIRVQLADLPAALDTTNVNFGTSIPANHYVTGVFVYLNADPDEGASGITSLTLTVGAALANLVETLDLFGEASTPKYLNKDTNSADFLTESLPLVETGGAFPIYQLVSVGANLDQMVAFDITLFVTYSRAPLVVP